MDRGNFHLSLPCLNVSDTVKFYAEILKCMVGRNSTTWADIDLYGNQLTFMESKDLNMNQGLYKFEGEVLPQFHFGVIMEEVGWNECLRRLNDLGVAKGQSVEFLVGRSGHHRSFFVDDPNGYTIEFKCFVDSNAKFESD